MREEGGEEYCNRLMHWKIDAGRHGAIWGACSRRMVRPLGSASVPDASSWLVGGRIGSVVR
jgi:hypothetical protein